MIKEQNDLLVLLNCALWQNKDTASCVENPCWERIYQLAVEQCVVGVIADSFRFLTPEQGDREGKIKWLGYVVRLERKNAQLDELVGKLFRKFLAMGLSPVLMKGQAFAANYPCPLHRQCGDIDVYFKNRDDCVKAVAWAAKVDRVAAESSDNKREPKHFTFSVEGNTVELHYYMCLFENHSLQQRLQRIIDEEFASNNPFRVNINGEQVETVPPTLSVLHQIIHISRHLLEAGIGLRQICDLALYLDRCHDAIDKEKLMAYFEELQLMRVVEGLGYIMVRHLGLKEEKCPFESDGRYADFLLDEIFDGGNFGKKKLGYREESRGYLRKLRSIFYFYKRCRTYKPLMPREAKSYFLNKISLNIKLVTKHHY